MRTVLTFIFVRFTFHTENSYDHYDDNNGRGCQCNHEPSLTVKRFLLQITVFEVQFGRS